MYNPEAIWIAFAGNQQLLLSSAEHVARKTKQALIKGEKRPILIFNAETSEVVEVDFRGTTAQVMARNFSPTEEVRGPGRPKLGVTAREVTLLPKHWDWLQMQPGGASGTLRRMVEEAIRTHGGQDRVRQAQDAVYKFMTVMGGNLPGYEEALRSFYAGKFDKLGEILAGWPKDIAEHSMAMAVRASNIASKEL